jgi:hypothetical protein
MDRDWRIPAWAIEGGLANVRGQPRGVRGRIGSLTRGGDRPPELLQPESPES